MENPHKPWLKDSEWEEYQAQDQLTFHEWALQKDLLVPSNYLENFFPKYFTHILKAFEVPIHKRSQVHAGGRPKHMFKVRTLDKIMKFKEEIQNET